MTAIRFPEDFTDISSEVSRQYTFPGGPTVTINHPYRIHVSSSGGHRIEDTLGVSHYIPAGWVHLSWQTREGCPAFVF